MGPSALVMMHDVVIASDYIIYHVVIVSPTVHVLNIHIIQTGRNHISHTLYIT